MRPDPIWVREDATLAELVDVLIREHIHGAPVVDEDGMLCGVVSQQDAFFGAMTRDDAGLPRDVLTVRDMMTAPAVSATEETSIQDLCEIMQRLRIHRIPIVRSGRLVGIVSSLDVCGAVARRVL